MSQDASYLRHIPDAIAWIEHYAAVDRERCFAEHLPQAAIIRQPDYRATATMSW